eukprot:Skav221988  [mRNA]  locus=scaffold4787:24791:34067:- [translate_table: standard]
MGLLRSEPMKHGTLVVPVDRAREFIDLIGVEVNDGRYIQRIDEMERIIRFLLEELTKVPGASPVRHNVDAFLDHSDDYKLDDVEAKLHNIHKEFIQFKEHLETMFSNIAGVIHQEEQDRFARMLFRATRGNTFTHFQQIFEPMRDPKTGREVHKSVFVIYFQDHRIGASVSAMSEKINKRICNSFGVNTYRWPSSRVAAQEMNDHLKVQVEDQERLLRAHENFVKLEAASLLEPVARNRDSLIEEWRRLFCIKEKSIYATLNLFEGNMNLRASCWYPEEDSDGFPFVLVNTYGLPRYQEANPALFTIATLQQNDWYLNSMKMKLAVVLGVAQMLVGLLLRFRNAMYEKNKVDFACECLPMFIFMICFFGFMDYMILFKWVTPMRDPPSIINSMIAAGQAQSQPSQRFRASSDGSDGLGRPAKLEVTEATVGSCHMPLTDEESLLCEEEQEDEFDLTEVIETIEYVLGTVSHTASYLRLWALSLAHQQLQRSCNPWRLVNMEHQAQPSTSKHCIFSPRSLVFFGMTMLGGMSAPFPLNIFTTYFAFGAWFGVTVFILLGMDVMECFLHTLRLHWVASRRAIPPLCLHMFLCSSRFKVTSR